MVVKWYCTLVGLGSMVCAGSSGVWVCSTCTTTRRQVGRGAIYAPTTQRRPTRLPSFAQSTSSRASHTAASVEEAHTHTHRMPCVSPECRLHHHHSYRISFAGVWSLIHLLRPLFLNFLTSKHSQPPLHSIIIRKRILPLALTRPHSHTHTRAGQDRTGRAGLPPRSNICSNVLKGEKR